MERSDKILFGVIGIVALIFFATMVYDMYNEYHMKTYAQECGWGSSAGGYPHEECQCNGTMVNSNSVINPLMFKVGGVGYYCYGECYDCKCYLNDEEVDCSEIQ